jgi:hypothetical protein
VLVEDELPLAAASAVDVVVVDEFHAPKLHHQVLPRIVDCEFVEGNVAQGIAGVVE